MKRISILYLEDNELDIELVKSNLEAEGIESDLQRVETRAGFVAALAKGRFDIILTDYALPSFNGMSALRLAAEMCPEVPVIMISGAIGEEIAVDVLKSGATDFVLKRRIERLAPAVERALREAEEVRARRRAEEAVRDSEERLQMLFESAPDGFYLSDLKGNFIDGNKAAEELLGYKREELIGKNFTKLGLLSLRELPKALKSLARNALGLGSGPEEYNLIRKGGSAVPVEIRTHPVRIGGKTVVLGIARDITERKRAEEARELLLAQIRRQAQQMQGIIDTVPEGVLLLDAKGQVILVNPEAEGSLGLLAEAKVGDTITHLGGRPLAELLTSPPTKGLWHEVKAEGRTFEVIARPMEKGAEPENWVLVVHDVTQEREIQQRIQQQERLAAVGQLAAGIAHDFNNIMAVVVLYTQMGLRMPDIPTQLRDRLQIVDRQAKRATDLIEQILDFSRRAVLERRPMDLTPFLKEMVKLLERTVPESIKMEFTYGGDEYTVNVDPTRIQQAVMNLVLNARDAMLPKGGGKLEIELDRVRVARHQEPPLPEMEAGEWVRVRVTDTGSGIPPEVLPHIFEPFYTTKEVGKGTGLGLAQVHGIVKQHEGHIDVSTKVGEGTTFTLYLPTLVQRRSEAPAIETRGSVQGHGETILVVEDHADLRKALAMSVEMLNYRVLAAADGHGALDILEQHAGEVSLVLSDLVMPEMGGQALFHAMRQRGLTVPMVLLSGHPMEREMESLREQGLAGWMLKPPNLAQLSQLLARALKR